MKKSRTNKEWLYSIMANTIWKPKGLGLKKSVRCGAYEVNGSVDS